MSADYLLEKGDLLFARTGASVGKTYLYRQYDGTVYFAGFLIRARIEESADPEFVYQATLTDAYKKYVAITSQRSGQPGVNAQEYADYHLMLPSRTEQQQIGMTLRSLDNLITLHQRKCQYRGLYGHLSWEQRKLGRLFFESNERSSSMEILSVSVAKGIYPASESDRDTNPGASLVNYKVVHKGDIVYNSMRMWQGAVGSSDYDGIVSPAYVVARPAIELDTTCFGYLLKRPEMLYKYLCDSQGNSKDTQTLKFNRFADIEVTMPANLEEQRVISACLGRVDALITLHQREPPHMMKEDKNANRYQ